MPANSPIKTQSPDEEQQDFYRNYALSGRLILASIISILVILVIFLILHFYARWYLARLHRRQHTRRRRNRQNRRNNRPFASSTGGLDASVLNSLPLFVYSSERVTKMEECAVCLSEFENGENGRVLPNCKHSFHTECIDMWFYSHSTCPLCRSPVEPVETEMTTLDEPGSGESLSSPVQPVEEVIETTTDDDRRKRIDVRIEVPNRNESVAESEFRLPSASQEFWSPGSRLASLKRIMNMSRRSPVESPSSGVGPSCAPVDTELDIETGIEEVVQESSRAGATESDQTRGAMSGGIYDQ